MRSTGAVPGAGRQGDVWDAYRDILAEHSLYAVGMPELLARLPAEVDGVALTAEQRIDPLKVGSAAFLRRLERLDALAYGPRELTMPRWAFYDCAELPGAIFGLGRPAAALAPRVRRLLQVPEDYAGLVPLSLVLTVPMLEPDHWLGYALCDLHEVAPGAAPVSLRLLSLALALGVLGVRRFTGTSQWASPKLRTYARFGPLRVYAAWVPAHSEPATCTFGFDLTPARLRSALRPEPCESGPQVRLLDVDDRAALRALQHEIEGGARVTLVGPPQEHGAFIRVPLRAEGAA